eukprot:XP_014768269.1 PREDICTED: uncharacterized protein K02A2.6-like [Octopus bimaculoides]
MLTSLDFTIAYLDDILIKSESCGQHAEQVKKVFKRRKDYGFKLNEEKCEFFMPRMKYLGQIIDENRRRPDLSRIPIQNGQKCVNVTNLHSNSEFSTLFARYDVPDTIVSDNTTQFTASEFKKFCKMFSLEHITILPYHRRSNGQAEHFVDMFKRALRKSRNEVVDDVALQQSLRVYCVMPNSNTPSGMSPAELMFARKIVSFWQIITWKKNKNQGKY